MNQIEELRNYGRSNNLPISCSIELTQNCNFKCVHCYCSDKEQPALALEDIKVIVDKLVAAGCFFFTLTGGEIFTRKDFADIYRYIKSKGTFVSLLTNASHLNNELISLFKQLPPWKIHISLYGTNFEEYQEQTGNGNHYHQVMNALDLLKENNLNFTLRTMASKNMHQQLKAKSFLTIANKYAADFNYDTLIFPKSNGDKCPLDQRLTPHEIVELEAADQLRDREWSKRINDFKSQDFEFQCSGGKYSLFVDLYGRASICSLYRQPAVSLLEHDMDYVWSRMNNEHEFLKTTYAKAKCGSCSYNYICRWCPGYSVMENRDADKPIDYFCQLAVIRYNKYKNEG